MTKSDNDKYGKEEAEKRLQAALRGSRVTGHKSMTDIPKKRTATMKKRALKPKKGA